MDKNYSVKVKRKGSEVEIEGEIATNLIEAHRKGVLDEARRDMVVPGFRKGNVPDNIVLSRLNEYEVLQEAAERALNEIYPEILKENDIDSLGNPEVSITKLAAGNPMGFKLKVGVIPEIKLPDYKKIAKKAIEGKKPAVPEVTDKELDEMLTQVMAMRNAGKEGAPAELTDEFVKTLGKFESVADFRAKMKENIIKDREEEAHKAVRHEILKGIVEASKLELPEMAVANEVAQMHARLLSDLAERNSNLEEHLKKTKKTQAELEKQQRESVERTLKTRLVLDKIATDEKITPDHEDVDRNVEFLMMKNPGSDRDYMHHYVETVLANEAVIDFLEREANKKED